MMSAFVVDVSGGVDAGCGGKEEGRQKAQG
jgi:hypothetical protein